MQGEIKRIEELDGLRALAIVQVLLLHYVYSTMFPILSEAAAAREGVFDVFTLFAGGWAGVDLFFVLSGFLIGGILIDNRAASNVLPVFFVRRACRILPIYLVMVGLFYLINATGLLRNEWLFSDPLPAWSYFTFTQNFFMAEQGWFGNGWLGVTWSLALEEQFYLIIPFVLVFLPRKVAIPLLLIGVISAPIVRANLEGLATYVLPFSRTDGVFLGVLCAFLVRDAAWSERQAWLRPLILVLLPILLALCVWSLARPNATGGAATHSIFALAFALLLLAALAWRGSKWTSPLRWPFVRWIGGRSYAVYLFHQPVIGVTHQLVLGSPMPHMSNGVEAAVTGLALVLTFALAELSFRVLEQPFLKLGARYKFSSATPLQGAPNAA